MLGSAAVPLTQPNKWNIAFSDLVYIKKYRAASPLQNYNLIIVTGELSTWD